ncbi:YggS family pyridoxal phosphate-dependent enzyme [Corynebacterium sp. S7]
MSRYDEIKTNLEEINDRIHTAEKQAGREVGSVTLLPVTKFHPVEDIVILGQLGITLVGENREQEARGKAGALKEAGESSISIAMIGQIQSKKANAVARWAKQVHSVDSVKLAQGLDRGVGLAIERGDRESGALGCLAQVSMDNDPTRGGVPLDHVEELAEVLEEAEHLSFDGIMVVPPLDADPSQVFDEARALADRLGERVGRKLLLSAGMSGDFEKAIAHGSDIVRVGTGVLGARNVG